MQIRVRATARIPLTVARFRPHAEIGNVDAGAGRAVGAGDFDGTPFGAVGFRACPVGDGDVGELDAGAGHGRHGGPVLVDVEAVGVAVADEVFQGDVLDGAGAAVGFDLCDESRSVSCMGGWLRREEDGGGGG